MCKIQMDDVGIEFCLFVTPSLNKPSVIRAIAACFKGSVHYGDELNSLESSANDVSTSTCFGDDPGAECKTLKPFILIRVFQSRLRQCAFALRPDLVNDPEALYNAMNGLSHGQKAWLAEIAIRTSVFKSKDFKNLKLSLPDHDFNMQHESRANLLTLQRLDIVTNLVLRHDKAVRRQLVSSYFSNFRLFIDVDQLRDYFGDSVGFYFLWMKHYSLFLLFPTCAGLLHSAIAMIVTGGQTFYAFTMSMLPFENFTSGFMYSIRLFYTFSMVTWALVCTKLWQRLHATSVERWSTNALLESTANDFEWLYTSLDERPEFRGIPRKSPVTNCTELHFPARKRRIRFAISGMIIMLCFAMAGFVNVLLMNLEGYITPEKAPWLFYEFVGYYATTGAIFDPMGTGWLAYFPGVLHSILIFVMNQLIFRQIAELLTGFENHQTIEAHDRALVFKRFLFELVDAYGCLIYLGFVQCDRKTLQSFMLTMLATDSIRRVLLECVIPFLLYHFRIWSEKRMAGLTKRHSDTSISDENKTDELCFSNINRELYADVYEPFDDYLEMVLQHGYLVLFAYVCPTIAAPIALISTVLEARYDAFKMLFVTQRPTSRLLLRRNFVWLNLLSVQAWLSILTNVGLATVSIEPVFEQLGVSGSLVFLILEHILIALSVAFHFMVAEVPAAVRDARRSRSLLQNRKLFSPFVADICTGDPSATSL